ncbi:MAG: magnesium/cobalt transporter CorA [Candidatus Magnetoovum sp. WYHC-5]|nr:magnesium/cobalt transporter CorA [Candidatus Magnetoovum sp. WYHC-5]
MTGLLKRKVRKKEAVTRKKVKILEKRSQTKELVPGTAFYVGEIKTERVKIEEICYGETWYEEKEFDSAKDCISFKERKGITWINIEGLHDVSYIAQICNHYNLHNLTVEDIVIMGQRPKIDIFEDYVFMVLPMHIYDKEYFALDLEQISIILGKDYVLTFKESAKCSLNGIRRHIRENMGKIRKMGADYLVYYIIDTILDNDFKVLEDISEEVEAVEEAASDANWNEAMLKKIHYLKRNLIILRKSLWPLREILKHFEQLGTLFIKEVTTVYIKDLSDLCIQLVENIEMLRDMVSDVHEIYLASSNNRLNEIMKFLTIYASIFIPPTLIASIYGMNFEYMPELQWKHGYSFVLLFMIFIVSGLFIFFKKKKWM